MARCSSKQQLLAALVVDDSLKAHPCPEHEEHRHWQRERNQKGVVQQALLHRLLLSLLAKHVKALVPKTRSTPNDHKHASSDVPFCAEESLSYV